MNSLTKIAILTKRCQPKLLQSLQSRMSSFNTSQFLCDLDKPKIKYETTNDPQDWAFVERILPPKLIAQPVPKQDYPSGWKPQSEEALEQPYFVQRTKNYMMPVYMRTTHNGIRRLTFIRKIQGDIWQLEREIREFLQAQQGPKIRSQVNEFAGYICIHGDHVNAVKHWLSTKNF